MTVGEQYYTQSGYCDCACGTCFDVAIASRGNEVGTVLCALCRDAGCEPGEDCRQVEQAEDAAP